MTKFYDLFSDTREEWPVATEVGAWGGQEFVRVIGRHMQRKEKYPDEGPATGRPYEGIENLRPESKAAVEAFLMKQSAAMNWLVFPTRNLWKNEDINMLKIKVYKFKLVPIVILLAFGCTNIAVAEDTSGWQHDLLIYLWLPSIDGNLLYEVPPDNGSNVGVDAGDILDNLQMTFMGSYQARHDKWSILTDVIYLKLNNSKSTQITVGPRDGVSVSADVTQDLKAWVVTAALGYQLAQTESSNFNLLGGLRYTSLEADASLTLTGPLDYEPSTQLENSKQLWDAIIGVKGNINLNERWYLPYYADIGTGDSDYTWQALAGVGYQFDWGDVKLAYRHLHYDQSDEKFVQDLSFSGPALGVGFRF